MVSADFGIVTDRLVSCLICRSEIIAEHRAFYTSEIFLPGYSGGKYQISLDFCVDCDFAFQNPMPTQESLAGYYEGSPFASGNTLNETGSGQVQEGRVRNRVAKLLEMTGDLPTETKVLDIGAGNGTFLRGLPSTWRKSAVELSEAGRTALGHLGYSTFSDVDSIAGEEFDVIVMSSVLEHFSDPLEVLRKTRGLLGKSGILWLLVPNSHQPRLTIGEFFGFEHVVHFSIKSLTKIQAKAGFSEIRTQLMNDGALLSVAKPFSAKKQSDLHRSGLSKISSPNIFSTLQRYKTQRNELRNRFEEVTAEIRKIIESGKNLYIWGAGQHSAQILTDQAWVGDIAAFIDKRVHHGRVEQFLGRPVVAPGDVVWETVDAVFVSSESFQQEILHELKEVSPPSVRVIVAYGSGI